MRNNPKLSVLIVNWNTVDLLEECLQSIESNYPESLSYEVIVVDNDSSDGSADMVRERFPEVRLIVNTENAGFVRANNQAVDISRGEYLLLLNSDTKTLDGDIVRLIDYLDQHKDVGVVGGKALNGDGTFQPNFRRFPSFIRMFGNHTLRLIKGWDSAGWKRYRMEELDPDQIHEVDWLVGAYLLISARNLNDGYVFDSDIFMYYEDTLLCRTMRSKGLRVIYLPYARIIHYGGESAAKSARAVSFSFKSSVTYVKKVYGRMWASLYRTACYATWGVALGLMAGGKAFGSKRCERKYFMLSHLLFGERV